MDTCERPFCKKGRIYQSKRCAGKKAVPKQVGNAPVSEFFGVYWHISASFPGGEWIARVTIPATNGGGAKKRQLGHFAPTEEGEAQAAEAYNEYVIKHNLVAMLPLNQIETGFEVGFESELTPELQCI
jgi:hypothetical protein